MISKWKISLLLLIGTFLVACQSTSPSEVTTRNDSGMTLRKSFPVQLFMGACVISRNSPASTEKFALKEGFKLAPTVIAQNYLQGNQGKAWYLSNSQGRFGLSIQNNGLCSVHIHQGEPEMLQASMESWLPPEGSGFSYVKELITKSGHLTTTGYILLQGHKQIEQWVITTNSELSPKLVSIMSYNQL